MKVYSFQNPEKLTKIITYFLYTHIIVCLIYASFKSYQYHLIVDLQNQAIANKDILMMSGTLLIPIIKFYYASLFFTIISYFTWLYRANHNTLSFYAKNTKFTPGWSILWYFIPFMLFWVPYKGMCEIWKVSKNPSDWENEPSSALIKGWWFSWIASNVLEVIASVMIDGTDLSISVIANAQLVAATSFIVQAICAILLVVLIKEIYKFQMKTLESQKADPSLDEILSKKIKTAKPELTF